MFFTLLVYLRFATFLSLVLFLVEDREASS